MKIFINERPVEADEGSDALSAVRGFDPELARGIESGAGYLTDARAIRLTGAEKLSPGDILRVVMASRRGAETVDADA
jgi:hypothetical protein